MKNVSALSARQAPKGNMHIPIVLILLAAAGLLIWFLLSKGQLGIKSGITTPITPSQLMPSVSAAQARANICNTEKEGLFTEACQDKFKVVGKDDKEKLAELFSLVKKIQDDKSLSAYDRLLLSQAVFASLPSKASPQANLGWQLLAHLREVRSGVSNAYAQEQIMGEEEFKNLMTGDLKNVVDLPKGDNSWVINVMVSKYQWVNGQRQPIYSDQYAESFDPFPGVSTEPKDQSKIKYNVKSAVGSRATNQAIYQSYFTGTGEMTIYSFEIMSWYSPPYGSDSKLVVAEAGPDVDYQTSRQDQSETSYRGENLLSSLLNSVKMPTRHPQSYYKETNSKSDDVNSEKESEDDNEITCGELKKIIGSKDCQEYIVDPTRGGVWCDIPMSKEAVQHYEVLYAPKYTFTPGTCADVL